MSQKNKQAEQVNKSHLATKISTVFVILLMAAGIVMTSLFVNDVLKNISGQGFRLTEEDLESIEVINLEQLSELRAQIDKKNSLDAPRAGRLRNPFAEYVLEEASVE